MSCFPITAKGSAKFGDLFYPVWFRAIGNMKGQGR